MLIGNSTGDKITLDIKSQRAVTILPKNITTGIKTLLSDVLNLNLP
ncbi:hypothetical protein BN176_2520007 [Clostridioides difficile E19]|nr:hypothetical protein BN176_2520007 [Clostridioides difficile E19]